MTSKSLIVLSLYLILQSSYGDVATKGVPETFGLTQPTLQLHRLGKKSYYIGNIFKANLLGAEQFCRYHGMNLVNIESKEENDFLQKLIIEAGIKDSAGEYIFTSFTRIPDSQNYVSLTSGKTLTYFNWQTGQPNGGNEECIGLYLENSEVQWHDVSCWSKYYFICEVVWTNTKQELVALLKEVGLVDNIGKSITV